MIQSQTFAALSISAVRWAHNVGRILVGVAALLGILADTSLAQAGKGEERKIPPPEEVVLTTRDQMQIKTTYYAGLNGKESVPVVLLPMYKRDRTDYKGLALFLQSQGQAVLTVDLRGHGGSTSTVGGTELEVAKLVPDQFKAMVTGDMVAVKGFLWKKNNEGELNLNKLCIVGAEMGAAVAMDFAALDWNIPPYGALQQGGFVKALVLLSPEPQFKNLAMIPAIRALGDANRAVSVLVLVGEQNGKLDRDANRIFDLLKPNRIYKGMRLRPDEPKPEDGQINLWLGELPTTLQGTRMLEVEALKVKLHIAKFIKLRLVDSDAAKAITWKELKLPHQ